MGTLEHWPLQSLSSLTSVDTTFFSQKSLINSKMSSLAHFAGKWKEESSNEQSPFLKAVGVKKLRRRIAKRTQIRTKIKVISENKYHITQKLLQMDSEIELGKAIVLESLIYGKVESTTVLLGGVLVSKVKVLEPSESLKKAGSGAIIENVMEVKDGKLVITSMFGGKELVKTCKKEDGSSDKEEQEAEVLAIRMETAKVSHKDDEEGDSE